MRLDYLERRQTLGVAGNAREPGIDQQTRWVLHEAMLLIVDEMRSSSAVVILGSPNTVGHSPNARFILLLGMRVHPCPAPALGLQPAVQLFQAGEPQPGLEEATPDRLDLVLDLALLPSLPPANRRSARPCSDRP